VIRDAADVVEHAFLGSNDAAGVRPISTALSTKTFSCA